MSYWSSSMVRINDGSLFDTYVSSSVPRGVYKNGWLFDTYTRRSSSVPRSVYKRWVNFDTHTMRSLSVPRSVYKRWVNFDTQSYLPRYRVVCIKDGSLFDTYTIGDLRRYRVVCIKMGRSLTHNIL